MPTENPVCIRGGFWTEDAKEIKEEHLHIAAYPTNLLGEIGLLVRLAEPRDDDHSCGGTRCSVSIELKASYEQLAKLSKDLAALVRGDIAEVVFDEPA